MAETVQARDDAEVCRVHIRRRARPLRQHPVDMVRKTVRSSKCLPGKILV
jgi:hypothetical protein